MATNDGTAILDPDNLYGYVPTKAVTVIFLALFAISTVGHFAQAIKYRLWFMLITTFFCGVLEVAAWSSRFWSSISPKASTPFKIQTTAAVLAPTPLLAANFVIFGRIIRVLGRKYSRLNPRLYTIIFTSSDVVSLMIQGGGGGIAASAGTLSGANTGVKIILGGIIFQLLIIVVFSASAIEYFIRYRSHSPSHVAFQMIEPDHRHFSSVEEARRKVTTKVKIMSYALAFSTFCLFIRGIYRVVELSGGWHGKIIRTEIYFNVLDGMMIVLAIYITNFVHPGVYLPSPHANDVIATPERAARETYAENVQTTILLGPK